MNSRQPSHVPQGGRVTLEAARDILKNSPFADWWGVDLVALSPGTATLHLPAQRHFQRPGGILQGACSMMLGDVATWIALMSVAEDGQKAVTLEMKTNFLAPASTDLHCEGRVIKAGRRTVFCDATTHDDDGRQVAHHTVTYMIP